MADIAVNESQVAVVHPQSATIENYKAAVAIARGQAVYINDDGKVALAYVDATRVDQDALQFRGIALNAAAVGQMVAVLRCGRVAGFDVSSLNVGDLLYLSENGGAIADAASVYAIVPVGAVAAVWTAGPDSAMQKVLDVQSSVLAVYEFISGG